jgi:hypothetical protein
MSWQDYVDNQLLASQCVSKACIAGHDGGVWATSEGFGVSFFFHRKLYISLYEKIEKKLHKNYLNFPKKKISLNYHFKYLLKLKSAVRLENYSTQ